MSVKKIDPTFITLFFILVYIGVLVGLYMQPAPKPTPPMCKVCHCHKSQCVAVCSEENMCAGLCQKECRKP